MRRLDHRWRQREKLSRKARAARRRRARCPHAVKDQKAVRLERRGKQCPRMRVFCTCGAWWDTLGIPGETPLRDRFGGVT